MALDGFNMMMMMGDGDVEVHGAPDPYTMAIFQNLQNLMEKKLAEKKEEKDQQAPEGVDEKTAVGGASSSSNQAMDMEPEEGEDEGEAAECNEAPKKGKNGKKKRGGKKKGKKH